MCENFLFNILRLKKGTVSRHENHIRFKVLCLLIRMVSTACFLQRREAAPRRSFQYWILRRSVKFLSRSESGLPWRIVLLKVAYYATSSPRNFAKLCQNSQIMLLISESCSQNDVDSLHIVAHRLHQIMMFFRLTVVVNLFVFYGSLSRPSAVQISCSHL